jgi:hypothetical protein
MYIGKSGQGEGPNIAGRLNDHYYYYYGEKMGKWELFSWFGFMPVENDIVQVGSPASVADREREIGDIEALLIHLLTPDWNRNGGSYKHMEEYKQVPDHDE